MVGPSEQSVEFFPRRGGVSSHRCFSRPNPPFPPPHQAWPLSLKPPSPPPSPQAPLFQRRGSLRLQGSDREVLSIEGWPIRYDRVALAYMKGQSRERTSDLADHSSDLADHTSDLINKTSDWADHTSGLADHTSDLADLTSNLANHTSDLADQTFDLAG